MRIVVFLQVVRHFGGEGVTVALLADSRVGSVSPLVEAFQCFLDGSFTIHLYRFGGKIPPGQ